ncbi:MAG: efflux RND transporter permease subunit, partial [Spirosomaceae bacterium]|nr:efflux RND transporter permease subunit [Spirosomataceae bacterium]
LNLAKTDWWSRAKKWIEEHIDRLNEWYGKKLEWTLNHKTITLTAILAMFVGSVMLVANGFIGSAFIERGDRGEALFYIETDKSSTLEFTDTMTKNVEQTLLSMPEVKTVLSSVGVSGGGREAGGLNAYKSELTVKLKEGVELTDAEFIAAAREKLGNTAGVKITTAVIGITGSADSNPVQLIVSSNDFDEAIAHGKKVKDILLDLPGTTNVQMSIEGGVPEVKVKMDKEKMNSFGLNVATVGATMANAYSGNENSKFSQGGTEYDIVVQLEDFDRRNPDDVKSLSFINSQGKLIRLDQFAEIITDLGPSQLERTDRISSVKIESGLQGRQIGEVVPEINAAIAAADFPPTVSATWIGESSQQSEAFGAIGLAFGIGLALIYLLMVLLYDNYVYPFVVLFAIPMALIGAFLALALAKSSLSVFTMMGIVVMMGLVCKNSILIVDFANKEKEDGKSSFAAILAAGRERLRPIMMTTIAMVFGMLPVAIASGAGAEWKNGLGWTLIGGLTSSMCLTIFIVPIVYLLVDYAKERFAFGNKRHERDFQLT